ncbi:MAG: Methyltransferase type 11 [Candidatus Gottesmanbacteria bacterium GW2011_GWA2_42_18]|uniref:Methyltransferase type 11 n=1 Tax=Candidatus Gottesmanbacteria bacterium GW2011_GWA2_42_18 TaxID=1618442 RepID=A0A0G0Z9V6_9BACT|nr:MAG: Methyltransferase type 11 [Candidatus Gottesmanbacteria bacterium GW2011_GWA2_42_18]
MALDHLLLSKNPLLHLTGVDVVPFKQPHMKRLLFRQYAGDRLPFGNQSFDAVFSYHVFHHTKDPFTSLGECTRVCRHRIIMVEPVLRYPFEKIGFACLDFATNFWKKEHVPIPYHIRTLLWWKKVFRKLHLDCRELRSVGVLPRFLPIGETMLFVLEKHV